MCPKPLHTKEDTRQFSQGSNFDDSSEFIGAGDAGEHIDSVNMRHDETDLDAKQKIGGEQLAYPAVNNACFLSAPFAILDPSYECIGTRHFFLEDDQQDHVIEFWASSIGGNDPFVRIDGIVVLMSVDFPITFNHHLQIDLNLNCVGGEIYITDYNVPPMIFNLKDLMSNGGFTFAGVTQCTQKYFTGFQITEYTVELNGDNNHPILIQVTNVKPSTAETIGTGGLDVGLYQYHIRKATNAGDKTGWSKASPLSPVISSYLNPSSQYPYTKTFANSPAHKSTYGIHLRFRIDNLQGYDYLEIKRTRYTLGSAPGTPGIEKLLDYRLQLQPNDFFIKDIYDIGALELALDDSTAATQFSAIKRAKAVRYYNMRLTFMNVEFEKRDLAVGFSELNGKRMFPVIKKMTLPTRQDGHKNPFNYAYYRSLTRGEKYGFAADFRDGNNQVSFAIPVPVNSGLTEDYQNYQMPNRRDPGSVETLTYSPFTSRAADVNGQVHQTHEVFDHADAITKTNSDVKNVVGSGYAPFRPTSQNDGNVSGHNYQINTLADQGIGVAGAISPVVYNPKAFGLNYYSLGMALTAVTAIPSYIKSFSIVRTKPAKRVVAQGIAHYEIVNPSLSTFGKSTTRFIFYSPDFDSSTGLVNFQDIIDSVAAGEQRYKVQCVSPVGFFSEIYNFYTENQGSQTEFMGLDLVHYARILREDGTINPGDTPSGVAGVGIQDTTFGYTGYGKWRRRSLPVGGNAFPGAASGNQLFNISSATVVSGTGTNSGRSPQIQIGVASPIFDFANGDPTAALNGFFNPNTQDWHEPMYIVNIIDTLADVPQGNISSYIETEHYQKIEAKIGISTGATHQEYLTVDERTEDFQPTATIGGLTKLIFTTLNGVQKVWYNVDGLSPGVLLTTVNNISNGTFTAAFNGTVYTVDGIFRTTTLQLTDTYNEIRVVFDTAFSPNPMYPDSLFIPDAGSLILIRYNTAEPVTAYGGETTIHEAVFSPFDLSYNADGTTNAPHTTFPAPFPYLGYNLNASLLRPNNLTFPSAFPDPPLEAGGFIKFLQLIPVVNVFIKATLRQMLCMFTCESRITLPYTFEVQGSASQTKYFPATHYIQRPFIWDPTLTPTTQPVPLNVGYDGDYPNEETLWGFGGFRFRPQTNLDYSAQDETHVAVSKPKVGFDEITLFCTGYVFSLQRPPNVIDAPGLRTFPATNFGVIEDDTGDIKYAYDDFVAQYGSNLYAITENGTYRLITDKTLLYTATGDQLAAIGASGGNHFITGYIPLSKTIGMNEEFWRSAAEGYNVIKGDNSFRRVEALFFSNRTSQYRLSGGAIFDILRGAKYHSKVFPGYLSRVSEGYNSRLSSVYDILHDEYWICADIIGQLHSTVAYGEKQSHYEGSYDYRYDKFVSFKGSTYGMRNAQTYLLNQYNQQINGADVESQLVGVSAKELPSSKEFCRVRISSNEKPDNSKFYNSKADYVNNQFNYSEIDTITLPLSLKNYGAYEGFIPRKVNGPRNRNQGRECIFVIRKTGNTAFKIVTVQIGYNLLK